MIRKMHKELPKVMATLRVLIGVLAMVVHAFIKNTYNWTLKMDVFRCV